MKLRFTALLAVIMIITASCGGNAGTASDISEPAAESVVGESSETGESVAEESSEVTESLPEESSKEVSAVPKKLRILFIGNSYTFFNDMPEIFKSICKAAGTPADVEMTASGGYYLYMYCDDSDELGKAVRLKLTTTGKYDHVIIQEQSSCPVRHFSTFKSAAGELCDKIRQNGATPWLYQTWGYRDGNGDLDEEIGLTTVQMEKNLRAAYDSVGETFDVGVAHVGKAMADVYANTKINVYNSDKSHPSKEGSYLAAWTIYSTIFGSDIREIDFDGELPTETSAIIKEAAYKASH